jgi:cytochrome b6-f complex iron-sulfur subunit
LHDENTEEELRDSSSEESRRRFLVKLGLGTCAATGIGAALIMGDFIEPKVLFEPERRFRPGHISDFPEGTVKFNQEHRVYLIGGKAGVFAMSAACTHLGCITRHIPGELSIDCPCHGSKFDLEGNVLFGPARKPLSWIEVKADSAGNLTVDASVVIPRGKAIRV